ncbi:MAG: hypothetical protein Q7S47_01535 [bacterium]|nr:hypothetical protein [bacterium]
MGTPIDFPGGGQRRASSEVRRTPFTSGTNPLVLDQAREIGKKLENIRHLFFSALGTGALVMAEFNLFELEHLGGITYTSPVDLRKAISDIWEMSNNLKFLIEEMENPGLAELCGALESLCERGSVFKAIITENFCQPGQELLVRDAFVRKETEALMRMFGEIMSKYISSDYLPLILRSRK